MRSLTLLLLILNLFISSCSQWNLAPSSSNVERIPASEVEELAYYLSIDKFKYYINEYANAIEGKAPKEIIEYLRSITVEQMMDMGYKKNELLDADIYDQKILELLQARGLTKEVNSQALKWEYNFFKDKLNDAFRLNSTKLDLPTSFEEEIVDPNDGEKIKAAILKAEEMTLDSGHYISNRTTRAIFWEANKSGRTIEFHLGDSREFLKTLKEDKGKVLFEIKPLAKNYNKIYVVQYPGESTYRYAITNIGGFDRLTHLTNQISLSNYENAPIKSKIIVNGDIEKFHAAREAEHAVQLKLLPKADRVFIGQKEAIDGKFELFWKINALNNYLNHNSENFRKTLEKSSPKDLEKLRAMMLGEASFEDIFKNKGIVEKAFESLELEMTKIPGILPEKFKTYNYDNFTIEMCDYVFKNSEGKIIRWRVVSNVWGDEIIPIAKALKSIGQKNITYMGTAGAFAGKGHKVGDLISPLFIYDGNKKLPMLSKPMAIEGAKVTGSVEHVGSPFEEFIKWLKAVMKRSEFVEVETSYLRRIFNEASDNLEIYLLISDVLGSETETLAHATSSKRKNAQNKLLASIFKRDTKGIPAPHITPPANDLDGIKRLIFKSLGNKSLAYKYFAFSHLKNTKNLSENDILNFSAKNPPFTDKYLLERLGIMGEVMQELQERTQGKYNFNIAFNKSLVEGTWNPKTQNAMVLIAAKNTADQAALRKILDEILSKNSLLTKMIEWNVGTKVENPNMIWMKTPMKIDIDFFAKIYSFTAFQSAGLYKSVTYNGNLTLNSLPTTQAQNPLEAFYQGKNPPGKKLEDPNACMVIMQTLIEGI